MYKKVLIYCGDHVVNRLKNVMRGILWPPKSFNGGIEFMSL